MVNTAIILAGGRGTRLKPLTDTLPKPLIPVHGKPLIEHLIALFKKFCVHDIYISVGYRKEQIKNCIGNGQELGINAHYIEEHEPLGTAGCLRLHTPKNPFFMSNGDELKNVNLNDMIAFHKSHSGIATLALLEVEDPTQYGVARMQDSRIAEFVEKPRREDAPSTLINSGLYLFDPGIVDYVPPGFAMLEKDVFPKLAAEGKLYGFPFRGQWFDTGTPERYAQALREWRGID